MSIKPTIGRRILFFAGPEAVLPEGFSRAGPGAFDAGVVYVWSDTCVNLDVCDHAGNHHPFTSVLIRDEGDEKAAYECWAQWMPYQVGQAAKTEEVEIPLRQWVKQLARDVEKLAQAIADNTRRIERLEAFVGIDLPKPGGSRIPAGARVFFAHDGDTKPTAGVVMSCPPDDGKYLIELADGEQVWVHESNMRGAADPGADAPKTIPNTNPPVTVKPVSGVSSEPST